MVVSRPSVELSSGVSGVESIKKSFQIFRLQSRQYLLSPGFSLESGSSLGSVGDVSMKDKV